jgi:uncharacterized protein YggE
MKTISIAALAAVLVGAVAVAVTRPGAAHGSAAPSDRTVTVRGTGTAHGAPNTALFTFGVDTDGATAKATLAANAAEMRRVIVALVRTGVARADIQTQNVSVYPRRTDSGAVEGYSVSGSVTAKVRRLGRAGAAVDAAVAAGANETSGPQFDRSSRSELTQRALHEAFADARAKAETLAKDAGASLGQVGRIEEATQGPEPVPMGVYALAERTPIEPGTQDVRATVTVTFTIA